MKLMPVILLGPLLLAGCASDPKSHSSFDDVMVSAPNPDNGSVGERRIKTTMTQADFPDGETGHVMHVQELDPVTGAVKADTTYSFNGLGPGRAILSNIAGPALLAVGGIGAAKVLHSTTNIENGSLSVSGSISKAGANASSSSSMNP